MSRDYKIIRLRDRELGDHTLVVSKSWGRFPEVWDVVNRFPTGDRGIRDAHDYVNEALGRQHELRENL